MMSKTEILKGAGTTGHPRPRWRSAPPPDCPL